MSSTQPLNIRQDINPVIEVQEKKQPVLYVGYWLFPIIKLTIPLVVQFNISVPGFLLIL